MTKTIATSQLTADDLDRLTAVRNDSDSPQMRAVLDRVITSARHGHDLAELSTAAVVSPQEAADSLGMSRTHLYKLLDRGVLPSHRVGSHRKIQANDLEEFRAQREADKKELAERFASQDRTRKSAIDEIADLI
ncbi:helix-turn-helix domain-containing protein [uncultured Brevibacterium sp.]|uniref:helix-turn-helix domain-containing protein n=1 Tax=uncultured Brevibacterium sp. TaxID=189678 RepID=UPI0025FF0608|nr:helix-turn-helix domain-containing protein [uncultured Brevibacterium sp.]